MKIMQGISGFSKELSAPMFQPLIHKCSSTIGVDIESRLMHHESSETRGRVWKRLAFSIMFIIPMVMLILIACYGYKLTTMTKFIKVRSSEDGYTALLFGVLAVVFGLAYFSFGLIIVAEIALDLLGWFRRDDNKSSDNEGKEQITCCQITVNIIATTLSMFMLMWAIYSGYKLAVEAREVVIYSRLAFLVGVTSMGFGFIYFIYGICIAAESTIDLPGRLHQAVDKSDALFDKKLEVNLEV